ncbi:acyltransferase [Aquipseudomonas campi]|uniref:Acyltransferase n=1 Tax=Aquipseudomonas campi TaxID=2731681 RepID=A0A6M8G085_9GAMM|nr:acyltransferase family protein [Pseudomonas campi]QKE65466.1 acyltransferase [Pseudomonas campi]
MPTNISSAPVTKRRDIQIIRALAVLSVIFFHLNENYLPFGYVGVDIFFVISGYVITRGILIRQSGGVIFSGTSFLERRINRLFPPLLFMLFLTTAAGILIYPPSELKALAYSAIYALSGVSNIYFFTQTNYFSAPLDTLPLLHTWSLSVEEQFYLLFASIASLLIFFQKRLSTTFFTTWCIIFFASIWVHLQGSTYLSETSWAKSLALDDIRESLNFFLLSSRAYQLSLGILGAYAIWLTGPLALKPKARTIISCALFSIICLLIALGSSLPQWTEPSIFVICAATLVFLITGESKYPTYSHGFFVPLTFIGDRSYSLYLMHWPVIVYLGFYQFKTPTLASAAIALALTFSLAEISYRLFENQKTHAQQRISSIFVYASLLFFSLLSAIAHSNGIPGRIEANKNPPFFTYKENIKNIENKYNIKIENPWATLKTMAPRTVAPQKKVLVLGDSHASHLSSMGKYYVSKYHVEWTTYTFTGCPPIFGHYKIYNIERLNDPPKQIACREQIKTWESFINKHSGEFDYVILSSRWNWMFNHENFNGTTLRKNLLVSNKNPLPLNTDTSKENFVNGLQYTTKIITKNGMTPIIFGQPPLSSKPLKGCDEVPRYIFDNDSIQRRCNIDPYSEIIARGAFVDSTLRNAAAHGIKNTLTVVSIDLFCDHKLRSCNKFAYDTRLFDDTNHLNKFGSLWVAKEWEKFPDFPFSQNTSTPTSEAQLSATQEKRTN